MRVVLKPLGCMGAAGLIFAAQFFCAFSSLAAGPTEAWEAHRATAEDQRAIEVLLNNYTRSVTEGDSQLFESQLLHRSIPFSYVDEDASFNPSATSVSDYAGFKASVFDSGQRFHQSFSHVEIRQDANLAQVSLDFETRSDTTGKGARGWKVLQLLRVQGHWKIVSELYTAYSIEKAR